MKKKNYWKATTTKRKNANHKNKHFNYRLSWRSKIINYAIVEKHFCCSRLHWIILSLTLYAGKRKQELRFTCCMIFFSELNRATKIKWIDGSERTGKSTKVWNKSKRRKRGQQHCRVTEKKMRNNIIYPLIIHRRWMKLVRCRCFCCHRQSVSGVLYAIKWAKEKEAPNLATVSSSQFNET